MTTRTCLAILVSFFLAGVAVQAEVPLAKDQQPQAAIIIGRNAGPFTRFAATELQKYLLAITGTRFESISESEAATRPAKESLLVLGASDQKGLASELAAIAQVDASRLKPEGFVLRATRWQEHPVLLIVGQNDAGAMYGAYELLEQLGITFRLTGDILPPQRGTLSVPDLNLTKEPAFPRRGFLHTAVYNNVTMFSWPDYEQLLDQICRMKCNYVQFWWFEYAPWLRFSYRGEPKAMGDVANKNSGFHNWTFGGFGSRTIADISIGREHFTNFARMAPVEMQHLDTSEQAFDYCTDLLHRFIAHAAKRNIKVWLAVESATMPPNLARHGEIVGDAPFHYLQGSFMHPLDPINRELQVVRLKALADTYPEAEGVYLNFAELYADIANEKHHDFFQQHRAEFQDLRTMYLPWSGALANFYEINADKMIDSNAGYFDLFTWLLKKRDEVAPKLKLGLMTVGRGYALPLFHKKLPLDVPFASLESSGVWTFTGMPMEYFGDMGSRERILQPRIDDDFEMVGMQFNVRQFAEKDRIFTDGLKYGLSGVAGQIDRPRGTEFNSSYLAEACWEPNLTPEQFYRRSAERMFGQSAAEEMAKALLKLEEHQLYLGYYEYEGGYGVLLCCSAVREVNAVYNYYRQKNPYAAPKVGSWQRLMDQSPPFIAKREGSIRLLNEALSFMRSAMPKVTPESRHELDYLINRTESYRDLFAALNVYRRGMVNFDSAFRHKEKLDEKEFVSQLESSLEIMRQGDAGLKAATKRFSEIVDHISDLAVLYELNARLILGTDLSLQFLQNVVNYHAGRPFLNPVAWDRLFPRRPDKGVEE